jgi:hypothetical protein
MFHSVMLSEAIRQGVNIQSTGADAVGEFGRRRFGYRGEPAPVEEWLADGEPRIRDALEAFMPEAGQAIWRRILDRD